MTTAEAEIMRHFQRYRVRSGEMLFFNSGMAKSHPPQFHTAMASLVREGLVMRERRRDAYSLTPNGYRALRQLASPA